jgi:hypothetical protein
MSEADLTSQDGIDFDVILEVAKIVDSYFIYDNEN